MSLFLADRLPTDQPSLIAGRAHVNSVKNWATDILPSTVETQLERHQAYSDSTNVRSRRKIEFAHGRKITATLLERFGEAKEVGVAADRSPIWPAGFVGSISHSTQVVWAVVGQQSKIRSIGIDTEPIVDTTTLELLQSEIATAQEWKISNRLGLDPQTTFTVVFSAKEAFYKCYYPMSGLYMSFLDVAVEAIAADKVRLKLRSTITNVSDRDFKRQNAGVMPRALDVSFCVEQNNVFTMTWVHPQNRSAAEVSQ